VNPLVSVIIPNHNRGRFLDEAIQSVLGQSYSPLEVIVVDDGSTDDSAAVGARYADRITWIAQECRGVSAARNRAIAASHAPFVAFLDADDMWLPDKLARQMEKFGADGIGLVYCGAEYIDVDGQSLGVDLGHLEGDVLQPLVLLEHTITAGGSSAVVRRECLNQVGVFAEDLEVSEDWDLWRRIAAVSSVALVREPLVRYRQHPQNRHHDVDRLRRNMLRALDRLFSDPGARAVHPLERRSYARLYLTLAGSYAHSRRWGAALRESAHAIERWPPIAITIATRFVMRTFGVSADRRISDRARG
jgi:glycosyltransferase involved in cell wall biosynthesis